MPYAARLLDEEQNKQQQPNISGGAGANFAVNVPGQEPGGQKSSGQYTNIQSYLDANKDQAAAMGQNVSGKVDESASTAQQKINTFGSLAPKVDAYDPNKAFEKLASLSDEEKAQYKNVRSTGGYSGPDSLENAGGYMDVQKSYDQAKTRLDNSKSETGQQQLLRDVYARPQYTGGENKLDQVLLQNNAESRKSLEDLNQKYSGLNEYFKNTNQSVATAIEGSKAQADANKKQLLAAEQGQWKNIIDPIQARADQMNIDNPALYNRIQGDLSDNILNEETLQRLGLSPGQRIFNTQLGSYLSGNLTPVGLNEAATAEERAMYAALKELSGESGRNQIGADGQQINPVSFDLESFNRDLALKNQAFNDLAATKRFAASRTAGSKTDGGGWRDYSVELDLAKFLADNPNFNFGDRSQYLFPEIPVTDFGGVDGPSGAPIEGDNMDGIPIKMLPGQTSYWDQSADQQARENVKADLYNQILDFLNSQSYGRTIEKGG